MGPLDDDPHFHRNVSNLAAAMLTKWNLCENVAWNLSQILNFHSSTLALFCARKFLNRDIKQILHFINKNKLHVKLKILSFAFETDFKQH